MMIFQSHTAHGQPWWFGYRSNIRYIPQDVGLVYPPLSPPPLGMSSTTPSDPEKRTSSPSSIEGSNDAVKEHAHVKVALSDVDVAAQLAAGKDLDAIDEAEAKRVL